MKYKNHPKENPCSLSIIDRNTRAVFRPIAPQPPERQPDSAVENPPAGGWLVSWQLFGAQHTKRALMQFADNAGPDQPAHSRRLIRPFVTHLLEYSNQTARIRTLMWTFAILVWHMDLFPTVSINYETRSTWKGILVDAWTITIRKACTYLRAGWSQHLVSIRSHRSVSKQRPGQTAQYASWAEISLFAFKSEVILLCDTIHVRINKYARLISLNDFKTVKICARFTMNISWYAFSSSCLCLW